MKNPLLEVRDLTIHFVTEDGVVRAVENVSLDIHPARFSALWVNPDAGRV